MGKGITANTLLKALSRDDLALLEPFLTAVRLPRGHVLVTPNAPIDHVYFPEGGIASIGTLSENGVRTEVGIFGRDGVSATCLLLEVDRSPHETVMLLDAPQALRIDTDRYLHAIRQSETLRSTLLHYVQTLLVQAEHNSATHARLCIEARLARWILMAQDRLDGDELLLTHNFMARMITAERSGVTVALHILEGSGMIRSQRGRVVVLDRNKLETVAGESYGFPEAEYRKLIGPLGRTSLETSA